MSIPELLVLLAYFLGIGDTADAALVQDALDRAKGPIGG